MEWKQVMGNTWALTGDQAVGVFLLGEIGRAHV